jgi:hypothetical protein
MGYLLLVLVLASVQTRLTSQKHLAERSVSRSTETFTAAHKLLPSATISAAKRSSFVSLLINPVYLEVTCIPTLVIVLNNYTNYAYGHEYLILYVYRLLAPRYILHTCSYHFNVF